MDIHIWLRRVHRRAASRPKGKRGPVAGHGVVRALVRHFLLSLGQLTMRWVAQVLGVSYWAVKYHVSCLSKEGLAVRLKRGVLGYMDAVYYGVWGSYEALRDPFVGQRIYILGIPV